MGTRVVFSPPKKRSELEHFAKWFHQDWGVLFPTFVAAANAYVRQLSAERKRTLHRELTAFLDEHASATRSGLLRWWLKLGAQGGPRDLKDALYAFLKAI
jgi:hypothetical protein